MRNIKRTSIVAGAIVALLGGGIAFAAWTATGTGTGTVKAGNDAGLTVSGGSVSGLYPTGSQDVTVTVTNDNPYPVAVSSVAVGAITNDKSCSNTGVTTSSKPALTDRLAPTGITGDSKSYTFTVTMDANADNACQGATFTVPFTATGASTN
jgi:predicted ribosomally synthesized peptide with SipW-like signal peptide